MEEVFKACPTLRFVETKRGTHYYEPFTKKIIFRKKDCPINNSPLVSLSNGAFTVRNKKYKGYKEKRKMFSTEERLFSNEEEYEEFLKKYPGYKFMLG